MSDPEVRSKEGSPPPAPQSSGAAPDIVFLDVTHREGLDQFDRSATLEAALDGAGFERAGWMQSFTLHLENPYAGADGAEWERREARKRRTREPVMLSADRLTMALPDRAYGADWLGLLSVLRSGTVVRTHMRPTRHPRVAGFDDDDDDEAPPATRLLLRGMRRLFGDLHRASNRRAAGWWDQHLDDPEPRRELLRTHPHAPLRGPPRRRHPRSPEGPRGGHGRRLPRAAAP